MQTNIIVLAAQRPGTIDPLAIGHDVSHKCLIPIAGEPLIAHVLETLSKHPAVGDICISIEAQAFPDIDVVLAQLDGDTGRIRCVPSTYNLADSVIAALAQMDDGPVIITTADNALLTADAIEAMVQILKGDTDVALALAPKAAVLKAHPDGQRRFYKFSDDQYSNCNLYGLSGHDALTAAEIFRGGGQFAKKAGRIIDSFGLINLLLLRSGWISLPAAMARISKRIGLTITPVVLADGRNAIDVDNDRSYRIVADLLGQTAT
ncbi:NTP transferase domain-containing protein [Parasphingorhabdus cellanae]|uniref:NTP transferase domain-containing protein n=1 Tax=Parasphingorhabdus cellanae TaxID=2806553 RepID=A0ABX7T1J6_9SPHN|nr:NTP transferase domain-containing protein [Parasphingorhabdus cellanae]QTD55031.1 NTP transferase domain-containing protein [Parasphingorhabdus cellanae]